MKEDSMQRILRAMPALPIVTMLFLFLSSVEAQAQTGARVAFGVNPTIFRAGQPASAELSVTSVSTSPLTLPAGNTFTFFVDSSVGAVGSFTTPVSVSSA